MRRKGCPRRRLLAFALAVLAWAPAAHATGGLDRTFAGDGRIDFPATPFVPRAVAVDAAGRIVVAGYTCEPGTSGDATCSKDGAGSFRAVRLTPDGGLDPDFGANGFVTTPIGAGISQAFDLELLPDGRLLLGGGATTGGRNVFALVRYTANGALDPEFGTGGVVLQAVGSGSAAITDLAAGPGGTILAAGQAYDDSAVARTAVARFLPGGGLDTTFASRRGVVLGGTGGYNVPLGLAVGASGEITTAGIAGSTASATTYAFGEQRFTADGRPDPGFGRLGTAVQRVGDGISFANAVAATGNGGFVAAGAAARGGRQVMGIVGATAAGAPDPGFGVDGIRLVSVGRGATANDLVRTADGDLLAIGQAAIRRRWTFAVARLRGGGRRDRRWGRGGVTAVSFPGYPVARATAGALTPDGKLVTVGLGCVGGRPDVTCTGGRAALLVARQTDAASGRDTTPPRIAVRGLPRRTTARRMRTRGLPVRVRLSEPARVRVTVVRGGRRVARATRARTQRLALRLRAASGPGRRRITVRAVDPAGNASRRRFTLRVR